MIDQDILNKDLWWEIERYYKTEGDREELLRLLSLAFSEGYAHGEEDTRDKEYEC